MSVVRWRHIQQCVVVSCVLFVGRRWVCRLRVVVCGAEFNGILVVDDVMVTDTLVNHSLIAGFLYQCLQTAKALFLVHLCCAFSFVPFTTATRVNDQLHGDPAEKNSCASKEIRYGGGRGARASLGGCPSVNTRTHRQRVLIRSRH